MISSRSGMNPASNLIFPASVAPKTEQMQKTVKTDAPINLCEKPLITSSRSGQTDKRQVKPSEFTGNQISSYLMTFLSPEQLTVNFNSRPLLDHRYTRVNRRGRVSRQRDLHRAVAAFTGADAPGVIHGIDEHLAIADLAGFRGGEDGFDGGFHLRVRQDGFNFDLGQEIHGIFAAAI